LDNKFADQISKISDMLQAMVGLNSQVASFSSQKLQEIANASQINPMFQTGF